MTQMIETVAAVIEAAITRHGVPVEDLEGTLDDARAAILAMREPTEAMTEAGHKGAIFDSHYDQHEYRAAPQTCWQAMIDAALEGK